MIEGRTIICIASAWDYDPTSKHQIMRVLSRKNQVLWINYHGTRRPLLNRADARASWSTLRRVFRGAVRALPGLVHMTPLVIPGARGAGARWMHARLLAAQIRWGLRRYMPPDGRPVQVWSFAPDVPYLVGAFGEECFVYYCVDDHARFEGMDGPRIAAGERLVLERSDVVVATSQVLLDAKRPLRPDVHLVRHGVNYDAFAAAWREPLAPPADVACLPRPIFGFFGLIQFWVDVALIAAVARMRPDYSFVLIGECRADISELAALPNVRLLGRKAHGELPGYCAAFSAGMIPFQRSDMAASINPIKLYEYLAAGLPVIATPLPEAERYPDAVTIVDNATSFVAACDALANGDCPARRARISQLVAGESWEAKVAHLSGLVQARTRSAGGAMNRRVADVLPRAAVPPMNSVPFSDPRRVEVLDGEQLP